VPAGNLVLRDAAGEVVATADLELPDKLPPNGQSFSGTWHLAFSKPAFPSRATKTGAYKLQVLEGLASIDLNPGAADNNVVLGWSAAAEPITGTWYHATFSGGKAMGRFSLTRRPGDVR
jgi:hypothetical protein